MTLPRISDVRSRHFLENVVCAAFPESYSWVARHSGKPYGEYAVVTMKVFTTNKSVMGFKWGALMTSYTLSLCVLNPSLGNAGSLEPSWLVHLDIVRAFREASPTILLCLHFGYNFTHLIHLSTP